MRTFEEIAERAQGLTNPAPSFSGARVDNVLELIAELAEAMHRLEYNTAYQLALFGMTYDEWPVPRMTDGSEKMKAWEGLLHQKTQAALLGLRSEPLA